MYPKRQTNNMASSTERGRQSQEDGDEHNMDKKYGGLTSEKKCDEQELKKDCGRRTPEKECDEHESEKECGKHKSEKECGKHDSEKECGKHKSEKECGDHKSEERGEYEPNKECGKHDSEKECGKHDSEKECGKHDSEKERDEHESEKVCGEHESEECGVHESKEECGGHESEGECDEHESEDKCGEHEPEEKCGGHDSERECDDHGSDEARVAKVTTYNPMDTGWAWVILLCVFVIMFVCAGIVKSFGVFIVAVQMSFQTSASMVSVLGGMESACFSISGLVCMSVVLEMISARRSILIGALLGIVGFIGCFLATSIIPLILSYSLCVGTGFGLTFGPCFVLLNAYFKKKLPLAMGVANTGGSIGGIVMPIVTRMLLDKYFLSGAFLFLGGIYAHILVFGSLLTPPGDYKPLKASRPESRLLREEKEMQGTQQQTLLAKGTRQARNNQRTVSESEVGQLNQNQEADPEVGIEPLTQSLLSVNDEKVHQSRHDLSTTQRQGSRSTLMTAAGMSGSHATSISTLDFHASVLITGSGLLPDLHDGEVEKMECIGHSYDRVQESNDEPPSGCKLVSEKLSSMCDPALFRSVMFWVLTVYHYLGCLACALPMAYIPALAQEKGLTTTQGALLLTISGALDILSRLVPGILAQSKLVTPQTSVLVSLLVLGVMLQLTAFAEGMAALAVIAVVHGLFSGVFLSMLSLIILNFNDKSSFRQIFGFTQLALGVAGVTGFPMIGYLRDISGSYVTSFHFMGACSLMAAVLLLLMPVLHRREASRLRSKLGPERPTKERV